MHPDEYLEELKKRANARKRRSLETLHEVCREQHERGSKDFGIAVIARLSTERGGPKERTIRNPAGETYRGLIAEWARFTGGNTKRPPTSRQGPFAEVLSRIDDDGVRVYVGERLAELRGLRNEINLLKAQIRSENKVVVDLRPHTGNASQVDIPFLEKGRIEATSSAAMLTPSERNALHYAITTFIEENGYKVRQNGRVVNEHGRSIMPPGFVAAIEKVLGRE